MNLAGSKNGKDADLISLLSSEIRISEIAPFMRTTPEYIRMIIQDAGLSIIGRDDSHFIKEDEFKQALNSNPDYLGFMPYADY